MKKIVLFNTSYGSLNQGDFIICESALKEINNIIQGNFVLSVSTHNPILTSYQLKTSYADFFKLADYKFLLGTNIIKKSMIHKRSDWNVNIFNYYPYKNTILVGAGCDGNFTKVDYYTKKLYEKILNKNFYHSTRDEKTKIFLESIGFKAINTGCATLWNITPELCEKIPTHKSDTVIFTLTDYKKDFENDQLLIDILVKNYKKVYFWIQGGYDYDYFKTLKNTQNIKIISPSLNEYRKFLIENETDYIGTRLHAGIFAIQNKKRSIIITVDNRTRDMKESYNLNVIERDDIKTSLEEKINNYFKTKIEVNFNAIENWKRQFYKNDVF